ncbi:MAG: glycosyl transferase [Planctomycetota bacterium]|nr:MAG: glycosyl transferase [Planctomycetota bacterium]
MLNQKILFSVIIPLYNKASTIAQSIESIVNQTYQNFEIIIINDGSTDNSLEVVTNLQQRNTIIKSKVNSGVSETRNYGISLASGNYISFLDADDQWETNYLETIHELINTYPDCDLYATAYQTIDENGTIKQPLFHGINKAPWHGKLNQYFKIAAISDPPLWTSAITVTKKAINQIGGFPKGVTLGEDLLTWARIALNNKIAYNSKYCAFYNLRPEHAGNTLNAPDKNDYVGEKLLELIHNNRENKELASYTALWFRMRAVSFLELNMKNDAKNEIKKGLSISTFDKKLLLYATIAYAPFSLSRILLNTLSYIKNKRRKIKK